jgi:hypothetical protein
VSLDDAKVRDQWIGLHDPDRVARAICLRFVMPYARCPHRPNQTASFGLPGGCSADIPRSP